MEDRRSNCAFAVDWSTISSVQSYANFNLYSPDARVSRSVLSALQVLQNACVQRSRFD